MLDIQKRHADVFRVRIGEKGPKGEPKRLTDSLRVTSPSEAVVKAFVDEYGGGLTDWEGQHQAYLPITELPIMVLPGQSITQYWERYASSVCERRCDGVTEQLSGEACMCPPDLAVRMADADACRPMTRINFICPDVAVVGAGSLVTHGMIAAETLPQAIAVADAALSRGLMVPAYLRVIEHVGKKRRYIVPQLEIVGVSLKTLANGEVPKTSIGFSPKEVEAPKPAELPSGKGGEVSTQVPRTADVGPPPAQKFQVRRPARRPPLPGEGNDPANPGATGATVTQGAADEGGSAVQSAGGAPPVLMSDTERTSFLARVNKLKAADMRKCMDVLKASYGPPDQWLAKDGGRVHDLLLEYEQ